MEISITNPQLQTFIFGVIFCLLVVISLRKTSDQAFFARSRTLELKGFAILAIVFSHIGYFLVEGDKFLYPFSILAGVGVNLFLFLSGFGLTLSSLRSPLPVLKFYFKRLKRLFVPMWISVIILFALDFFLLNRSYPSITVFQTLVGYFPVADLFKNLNSPLWYFSLILFYYLVFPLVFYRKLPYLAPILILLISYFLMVISSPLGISKDVLNLYKLHFAPFPLGVLFAVLISDQNLSHIKVKFKELFLERTLKFLGVIVFTFLFGYFSIHAGTDLSKTIEQTTSLITMFCLIFLFIAKNVEVKLLGLFGTYSYVIYLIHWPILSRYGYFFQYFPASLATLLYLGLFLILGYLLQKLTKKLNA